MKNNPLVQLEAAIAALDKVLPIQAPLQDFVHFNPLERYEHLPFPEALRAAHADSGSLGYLPVSEYRQFFREGRITRHDLLAVLATEPEKWAERDLYIAALCHDTKPISFQQMRWQVEENHALERFQSDVAFEQRDKLLAQSGHPEAESIQALWQACLAKLDLDYALPHPEAMLHLPVTDLNPIWEQLNQTAQYDAPISDAETFIHAESRYQLHQLLDQVGVTLTLRGLLQKLAGIDVLEQKLPLIERHLASWLDQGIAALPPQAEGFYAYWREATLHDISLMLEGMDSWEDFIESLPPDPLETIHQELMRLGIERQHWDGYLKVLALELPGWSGMFNWRARHAGYYGLTTPVSLTDYLAVRLVLEHLFCRHFSSTHWQINATLPNIRGYFHHHQDEFFVRYHAYSGVLPEYLQQLAAQLLNTDETVQPHEWHCLAQHIVTWQLAPQALLPMGTDIYRKAWRLFHFAQHLALDAHAIQQLPCERVEKMLAILTELDDPHTSGYLWLRAYEYHYQEEVFSALLNKSEGDATPQLNAQFIFCMDDREESVRRHLEEIAPDIETFGAAGVFGLPNNWRALDAPRPLKLAQPVVTAVHELQEVPTSAAQPYLPRYLQRLRWLNRVRTWKNQRMRHSVFAALLSLPVLAPWALLELLGRSVIPATYQRWLNRWQQRSKRKLPTRVQYTALEPLPCPSAEHNQLGWSFAEKVEKVAAFLKLTGFTRDFAPLVVLMAHRSRHLNNPHILGYGCGACSGRFGGPNARAFASMVNEAAVREQLAAQHGIVIPERCWFTVAEHDTTSDDMDWLDSDLIPASHQQVFERVQQASAQAAQLSAQERCRKFASARVGLTPQQAKRHVEARAASPDQVRAELGHQGCAVAFVGRRALSKGIFWDRRAFLISYDPLHDPEGKLLEAQLQGNGVVGIGIQMDYYFSRMQNGYFGSGSKATHNLTGLFGVMEGGSSDLRTGLAQQMVELHEPMRLLAVVEAEPEVLGMIYQRHAYLRQLLDNEWVILAVKPPERQEIQVFRPGKGFVRWQEPVHPLPHVASSREWYANHDRYLPPAAICQEVAHA